MATRTSCRYTFSSRTKLRAERNGKRLSTHAVRTGKVWHGAQVVATLPPIEAAGHQIGVVSFPTTAGRVGEIKAQAHEQRVTQWRQPGVSEHLAVLGAARLSEAAIDDADEAIYALSFAGVDPDVAADLVLRVALASHFRSANADTSAAISDAAADVVGALYRGVGPRRAELEGRLARAQAARANLVGELDQVIGTVDEAAVRERFSDQNSATSELHRELEELELTVNFAGIARDALHRLSVPAPQFT